MKLFTVFIFMLFLSCRHENKDNIIKVDSETDTEIFNYYLNYYRLDSTVVKNLLDDACISRVMILNKACRVVKCFNPIVEDYEFTYFFKFDSLVAVNQIEINMDVFQNNASCDIAANLNSVINNIKNNYNNPDSIKLFICELTKLVYIAPFNCGLNLRMNIF